MAENKFLIKSTIVETIEALMELTPEEYDLIPEMLVNIRKIQDTETLFKLLISEYFKETAEKRLNVIIYTMNEVFEKEQLKELLWSLLKSRHYNDETQNKILFLIKSLGEIVNYDEYVKYFENPDAVIDKDTESLINAATFNPESQIDFLDFISTLNDSDWRFMLDSLSDDFQGDNLANIFVPLVYLNMHNEEKLNYLIDIIGKTSSALAIKPFEDIIQHSLSEKCAKNAKRQLNFLKLKGKNQKQADAFYLKALENSTFNEAYTSYLDGHGNQCLIISRKAQDGSYQYFSAVVRDLHEIIDCFGFYELSEDEYQKIIKRFVQTQRLIKIHQNVALAIFEAAEKYSMDNNLAIPYEYFCWKNLLADETNKFDLTEKLKEPKNPKYARFEFNEDSFVSFETWFFDENDDFFKKTLDMLIPSLRMDETVLNFVETLKRNALQFEISKKIQYRLVIMAIMMTLCGNKNLISTIAAINNTDAYATLEEFMMKHSVYEYFLRERENINSNVIKNVFTRKNDTKPKKFNASQIDSAISFIEGNW